MPASLYPAACSLSLSSLDMMEPTASTNDNRTEQLALQLALLQQGATATNLMDSDVVVDHHPLPHSAHAQHQHHHHHSQAHGAHPHHSHPHHHHQHHHQHHHHQQQQQQQHQSSSQHHQSANSSSLLLNGAGSGSLEDLKTRPSQNTTECVPVPSSEHVAEIVGRQGCKIKALRAKTNTYIKTPVRGEEPVFVVTGRKEDVAAAKREILSAADHFSQIRASRKNNINSTLALGQLMANTPGQTTVQVRVPYKVVGLVVGPKGATIKRIQQQTHTYIVTPSRDKEPVFEVTGLPENVDAARIEIEAHIALRTGQLAGQDSGSQASTGPSSSIVGHGASLYSDLCNTDDLGFHSNLSSSLGGNLDLISCGNNDGGKFSSILNGLDSPYSSLTGGNSGQTTGITLRSLLESNHFDLGIRSSNGSTNGHLIPWSNVDSHDSGIGNSPPFAGMSSTSAAADAGHHSLNSIWGDLNRALGGLDLNGTDNEPRAFANVGSRSSLDLGTLGRPLIGNGSSAGGSGSGSGWAGSQSPPVLPAHHSHPMHANSLLMNHTANNNKNFNGYVDSCMSLQSSRSSTTTEVTTPPSSILMATFTKEASCTSSNPDQNMVVDNKANNDHHFEPDTFIPEHLAFPSSEAPLSCAGDFF